MNYVTSYEKKGTLINHRRTRSEGYNSLFVGLSVFLRVSVLKLANVILKPYTR